MLKNKTIVEENLEEISSFLNQSLGRFYAINRICGLEGGGQNLKYTLVEKKKYTKSLCFSIMFENKTVAKSSMKHYYSSIGFLGGFMPSTDFVELRVDKESWKYTPVDK